MRHLPLVFSIERPLRGATHGGVGVKRVIRGLLTTTAIVAVMLVTEMALAALAVG